MGTTESKFIAIPFQRLFSGARAPPIVITAETMAHAIYESNMKLVDYFEQKSLKPGSAKASDTMNVALCCESRDHHALWLFFDQDPSRDQLRTVDEWLKKCSEFPQVPKSMAPLAQHLYVVASSRYWMLDIDKPKSTTTSPKLESMIKSMLGNRRSIRRLDVAVLCTVLGGKVVCKPDLHKIDFSTQENVKVHILTRDTDCQTSQPIITTGGRIQADTVSVRTLIHEHICGSDHSYGPGDIEHFKGLYDDCERSLRFVKPK